MSISVTRWSSFRDGFYELCDRAEKAVWLQHGEIDLVGSLILRCAEREFHAAEVDRFTFNGIQKRLACWLAGNSLDRFGDEAADEVAFERHKSWLRLFVHGCERGLVRRHDRQRLVAREGYDLADDHACTLASQLLRE